MPFDLAELEAERKRLDEIIRIASDPIAAAILERALINGKVGTTPAPANNHSQTPAKRDDIFPPVRHRGAQIAAVRKAISGESGEFEVGDIGNLLRASGTKITNVAVGRALLRLTKLHEIKIVHHGEGSEPNRYQKSATLLD